MATGGTLPTTRRQLISFYNTSGIIEKDKNMYFVPRFEKHSAVGQVKYAYKSIFETVCPPSSAYRDIEISTWSPEDRTLRVKGNVDDFRLITDEGACLNYFIVERTIITPSDDPDEEPVERIYLYAFFITGVRQAGGGSVEITCVPDDFTNVFYLHNTHQLTTQELQNGYEPFNERMKNCYVEKQHYNRVVGKPLPTRPMRPANQDIFLHQDKVHKYKYLYKRYKYPAVFTLAEAETINQAGSWEEITSEDLRAKIIKACISYVVVETKSLEKLANYYTTNGTSSGTHTIEGGNRINNGQSQFSLNRPNLIMAYPFIDFPEFLVKFKSEIPLSEMYLTCDTIDVSNLNLSTGRMIYDMLSKNAMAGHIYSAYVVRDIGIPDEDIIIQKLTIGGVDLYNIGFKVKYDIARTSYSTASYRYGQGLYFGGLRRDPSSTADFTITWVEDSQTHVWTGTVTYDVNSISVGLVPSYLMRRTLNLSLPTTYNDVTSNYFDPVLEAEPYSFYSISTLGSLELVLNKSRYFQSVSTVTQGFGSYNLNVEYYVSINGAIKVGYVPCYKIGNSPISAVEQKYFNEALSYVLSSSLPLSSSSYDEFYYSNMSQMKNQFAVLDYNYKTDFLQNFFVTSPNQVGLRASKAGGWGALAETGNQVMGWIDNTIDWQQNKNVTEMNQKAKLADVGRQPDTLKQTGSDVIYDLSTQENSLFVNYYKIDGTSYNSIAKIFERFGYEANRYDTLNVISRVGWDFIKLSSFDFNPEYDLMVSQEESIRNIFSNGVTLLHDKTYLTSGHNYETILE